MRQLLLLAAMLVLGVVGMLLLAFVTGATDKFLADAEILIPEPMGFVRAAVETEPVPSFDDAADDAAIWVHPTEPELSIIIGTDKQSGLAVYDLDGKELQFLAHGEINNVDIRYDFPLAGERVALVTASDRADRLAIYRVNPETRLLEEVAARAIPTGVSAYGICMYRSPVDGRFYAFINSEDAEVEQWELLATEEGKVDARMVREFDVGERTEGCVADDEVGDVYFGVQETGIWRYGAEPDAGTTGTLVDRSAPEGNVAREVEGLALYNGPDGSGYLIASSQTWNAFTVYRREGNNEYVMNFKIKGGKGIDGVTHTDGIDVSSANLGAAFPKGVFVAQDHRNGKAYQNFKLVSWQAIETVIEAAQAAGDDR